MPRRARLDGRAGVSTDAHRTRTAPGRRRGTAGRRWRRRRLRGPSGARRAFGPGRPGARGSAGGPEGARRRSALGVRVPATRRNSSASTDIVGVRSSPMPRHVIAQACTFLIEASCPQLFGRSQRDSVGSCMLDGCLQRVGRGTLTARRPFEIVGIRRKFPMPPVFPAQTSVWHLRFPGGLPYRWTCPEGGWLGSVSCRAARTPSPRKPAADVGGHRDNRFRGAGLLARSDGLRTGPRARGTRG